MAYPLTVEQQLESLNYEHRCLVASRTHSERLAEVRRQLAELGQPLEDMSLAQAAPDLPAYGRKCSSMQMFTIAWAGPFTQADVTVTQSSWGLYIFRGACRRDVPSRLQYCGITQQYYYDRFRTHRILPKIRHDLEIWLGQIVSPRRVLWAHYIQAEHMIIRALRLPRNTRRRYTLPPPTTIISEWYNRTDQRQANPHSDFPSIMAWDGVRWQKGNLELCPRM